MKKEQLPGYAVALAVLIVGLVAAGVPLASFLIVPLVLACPLMMIFMMRGMGSMDHSSHDSARDQHRRTEDTGAEEGSDADPSASRRHGMT